MADAFQSGIPLEITSLAGLLRMTAQQASLQGLLLVFCRPDSWWQQKVEYKVGQGDTLAPVAGGHTLLALFALWFGLSYGSIVSLLPAICMDYFGGRAVASVVGMLYSGAAVGHLLGPVLAGAAFDHAGHYFGVMATCGVLGLLATWASRQMMRTGRAAY